jgi:hypothetical protein
MFVSQQFREAAQFDEADRRTVISRKLLRDIQRLSGRRRSSRRSEQALSAPKSKRDIGV